VTGTALAGVPYSLLFTTPRPLGGQLAVSDRRASSTRYPLAIPVNLERVLRQTEATEVVLPEEFDRSWGKPRRYRE
jgi:hypothetical protein